MAPALVETSVKVDEPGTFKLSGVGDYKDLGFGGLKQYQREVEEKGTDKQPPASHPNYLPTWNPKEK
jgi:sulfonate dioxygenase